MTYYVLQPFFDGWRTDLATTNKRYARDRAYQLRAWGVRIVNAYGEDVGFW